VILLFTPRPRGSSDVFLGLFVFVENSIVGLPYDWRLSPDKMEERDGFLTLTRRRIEAAVQTNGEPGIMVAHSMGNTVFRYFLVWLRTELREEAYRRLIKQFERRAKASKHQYQQQHQTQHSATNTATTTTTTATKSTTPMATRAATLATIMSEQQQQPQVDDAPGGVSQFLPGWMTSAFPSLEDWWTWATTSESDHVRPVKLWELARHEGDAEWIEWIENHIWTYVGLSAPALGAINPLRAVLSGENMGLPWTDDVARDIEVTFGSTHTVNPMSSKRAFCDNWEFNEWDEEEPAKTTPEMLDSSLACLDDIVPEVEANSVSRDPWENFPALRLLLKERKDWDTDFPMVNVVKETCSGKEKSPCASNTTLHLGPRDVETGRIFTEMSHIWKERGNPMEVKREQLRESFWDSKVPNILNNSTYLPILFYHMSLLCTKSQTLPCCCCCVVQHGNDPRSSMS
jgi:Lecithin:cholesterol acyltransferase